MSILVWNYCDLCDVSVINTILRKVAANAITHTMPVCIESVCCLTVLFLCNYTCVWNDFNVVGAVS